MWGQKKFTNKTNTKLNGVLYVRAGDPPGRVLKKVDFSLAPNETKDILYGDDVNRFLEGIEVSKDTNYVSTAKISVTSRSSEVDDLMNRNSHVIFETVGVSLIFKSENN